jgi:hypothetical protein
LAAAAALVPRRGGQKLDEVLWLECQGADKIDWSPAGIATTRGSLP